MKLAYQAMDKSGRVKTDVIEAPTPLEATELLRREGLFVTELQEARETEASGGKRFVGGAGRGNQLRNVAMFTRQLSVLISTGTPLVQSIIALEKQAKNDAWRAVVTDVREKLEGGDAFSRALEAHPEYFDSVYRSLIQAGETSGQLDDMLTRLAKLARQRLHVRHIILGAMMYPAILIVVAITVLSVMIGFVLPRFTGLFDTLDAPLPPTTQMMLSVSEVLRGYWWGVIPGVIAVIVLAVLVIRSDAGRDRVDRISVRLPKFGRLVQNFAMAKLTRLLGILLESRVPLLEALQLTREGSAHVLYNQLMADAEDAVTRGDNFSVVLARSDLIDPTIAEAVRCGEQTGQMGAVLSNIADFLDEENEVVLKSLSSIIEPIILIVLGLLVGLVAISMFMPLFDITATVPGGGA